MDHRPRPGGGRKVAKVGVAGLGVLMSSALCLSAEHRDVRALLPSEESVEPWKTADEALSYRADNLYNFINGGAEVYLEYGFVQVISQEYAWEEDSIICTVYEMEDPQAAFGIFSYTRSPQKSPLSLGDGAVMGAFQLAFWQDRYFVIVESFSQSEKLRQALAHFARRISRNIGDHADPPALLQSLPPEQLILGSEKLLKGRLAVDSLFFLGAGGLVDIDSDDWVLYGEYQTAGHTAKLFLVFCGGEEKASRLYRRLHRAFSAEQGYRFVEQQGSPSVWVKEDRYYLLARQGNVLALVAGAPSLEEAQAIIRSDSKLH
ncbi:MAG: DUF6599 family protein [Acidobacteriota bacterium]